jgi:hypothetical protein
MANAFFGGVENVKDIINTESMLFLSIFLITGIILAVSAIYKIFCYKVNGFMYARGEIIDKWSRASGSKGSPRYYARIRLINGSIIDKAQLTKSVYREMLETKVLVAFQKEEVKYVMQEKSNMVQTMHDLYGNQR